MSNEANETVNIGKTVKVIKGRKAPIGTIGKVFYMQPYSYRPFGRPSRTAPLQYKVGLALDTTKDSRGRYANVVWTYAHNCEVVQQEIPAIAPRLDGQPAYADADACMVPA